jgi:hypothetical protein
MIPLLNPDETTLLKNSKGNLNYLLTTLPRHVDIHRYLNVVSILFSVSVPPVHVKSPPTRKDVHRNYKHNDYVRPPVRQSPQPKPHLNKSSPTLIPTNILTTFVNIFNNEYSIALMEEDLHDIEKGHSRYCKAISRSFPKLQVHTDMSSSSKEKLAEVKLLAQQLTQKQVELNLNVYREHRVSLLHKLNSFLFDRSIIRDSELFNHIYPVINKNFQKRRYYGRLKSKMEGVIKTYLHQWIHVDNSQTIDMDVAAPATSSVHDVEMEDPRRATKRTSQAASTSFVRPTEPPLKVRPLREKACTSSPFSPSTSIGSITPTASRIPSPTIDHSSPRSDTFESILIPTQATSMPPTRSTSPILSERNNVHLRRHLRPLSTRHTPYKNPRGNTTDSSQKGSMNLVSSKDAFVDLTTIRVTGKESFLTAQPTPESTHSHY